MIFFYHKQLEKFTDLRVGFTVRDWGGGGGLAIPRSHWGWDSRVPEQFTSQLLGHTYR